MKLQDFLDQKPLYYDKIDLDRMPQAYLSVKKHLDIGRTVHIVGTNGKGSTGRMLAWLLRSRNLNVGHYTSPHILRFNERIWINGEDISDRDLQKAHEKLQMWLSESDAESLSYFEYTTLLALVAFEGLDIIVLEAGLGGEFDATSVVDRELSVITPIGFDHQAFLGETIEAISSTKLRSMAKRVLVSHQPYEEVFSVARTIASEKGSELFFAEELLDDGLKRRVEKICSSRGWPRFFSQNAVTALTATQLLFGEAADPAPFEQIVIRGRFEKISKNVILDVGHNPLGARVIADALDLNRPVLVYNALADKDVEEVLSILAPHVSRLELIKIDTARAMDPEKIFAAAQKVGLPTGEFNGVKENEKYLVFGSFAVVEAFLKRYET